MITTRQSGFTLTELLVAFAIIGLGIAGILSVSRPASSGQTSVQLNSDLITVRSATRQILMGQGGYGTGSLNATLIGAKQVPPTMTVSGSTITTSLGGALTVTGNTSKFTIGITKVPADICTSLLTAANGWISVQVGSAAAITSFPVAATAATSATNGCGQTGSPFTLTYTGS